MATNYQLKPFRFNIDDLNFMMAQIKFKPLFDSSGNAIIAWDGTGSIFDAKGVQYNITGMNANAAISIYGTSYATAVSAEGLRDVTGMHKPVWRTCSLGRS